MFLGKAFAGMREGAPALKAPVGFEGPWYSPAKEEACPGPDWRGATPLEKQFGVLCQLICG